MPYADFGAGPGKPAPGDPADFTAVTEILFEIGADMATPPRSYSIMDIRTTGGVIPEPSTLVIWSLLGALGMAVGWWRRRKRAA